MEIEVAKGVSVFFLEIEVAKGVSVPYLGYTKTVTFQFLQYIIYVYNIH